MTEQYPCCDKMVGPVWLSGRYCRPVCDVHGYQEEPKNTDSLSQHCPNCEAQAAEIEKLREALREIDAMTPVTCDMSVAHAMGDIAHDALGETE